MMNCLLSLQITGHSRVHSVGNYIFWCKKYIFLPYKWLVKSHCNLYTEGLHINGVIFTLQIFMPLMQQANTIYRIFKKLIKDIFITFYDFYIQVFTYLFTCLFNNVVNSSNYIEWNRCGWNLIRPNLRYYHTICLKGLTKTMKTT
jgi:hypothetical protein